MKKLSQLIENLVIQEISGSVEPVIASVESDSRKVEPGFLFVATRGTLNDGHQYIAKAIESGAVAVVCEEIPGDITTNATFIKVKNSQKALGQLASRWYDEPGKKLILVGVTGTNGKTTIATLLFELFGHLGYFSGLLSTIENKIGSRIIPSTHTTPDALSLNKLLNEMVEEGCSHCFMEVSSHALEQGRTAGLDFDGAIFTNLTHDHLDYHKEFSAYLKAKKIFFDELKSDAFALVNEDDRNGRIMLQNCKAGKYTYAIQTLGDFNARILENQFTGLNLLIDGKDVWFRLVGQFNAYNLLAIYASAVLLKQEPDEVLAQLSNISSANGRFDIIKSPEGKIAIVDYAHTPDALLNILKTIKDIHQNDGKIITVVGAGGNRDKTKRPEMARIAASMSHQLILTSDNPRYENPEEIINDMKAGLGFQELKSCLAITNREEAIRTALAISTPGDVILIAGKGHETYQDIAGVKHHFDDKELINKLFTRN
jgi:UDP-N-acetylmuramoyl-L-alanyl-D-glutamate--2,6-diaminopimelate ligase